MTVFLWLGVALCGGAASVARFTIDDAIAARFGREFPLGILVINVAGSFAAGLLLGLAAEDDVRLLAATATLGSFTTFSTWMGDLERESEQGEAGLLAINLGLAASLGLGAAALGRSIGAAL